MALRMAADPVGGVAFVRTGIERLVARGDAAPQAVRSCDLSAVTIGSGHAVFGLTAGDIVRGAGLEAARGGRIRYIVSGAVGPVAAAEVQVDSGNVATRLISINIGPFVDSSARGLREVTRLAPVQSKLFEARLLVCGTLGLMAIWLRADDDEDILYPIAPTPKEVMARTPYSGPAFLAQIRQLAAAVIDAGRPGSAP
jgi:hypothetical protein